MSDDDVYSDDEIEAAAVMVAQRLRFDPTSCFIEVSLFLFDWSFSCYYDHIAVALNIGPITITFGVPWFWEDVSHEQMIQEQGTVVELEDFRSPPK